MGNEAYTIFNPELDRSSSACGPSLAGLSPRAANTRNARVIDVTRKVAGEYRRLAPIARLNRAKFCARRRALQERYNTTPMRRRA
jgi:hypothetical protein